MEFEVAPGDASLPWGDGDGDGDVFLVCGERPVAPAEECAGRERGAGCQGDTKRHEQEATRVPGGAPPAGEAPRVRRIR